MANDGGWQVWQEKASSYRGRKGGYDEWATPGGWLKPPKSVPNEGAENESWLTDVKADRDRIENESASVRCIVNILTGTDLLKVGAVIKGPSIVLGCLWTWRLWQCPKSTDQNLEFLISSDPYSFSEHCWWLAKSRVSSVVVCMGLGWITIPMAFAFELCFRQFFLGSIPKGNPNLDGDQFLVRGVFIPSIGGGLVW